MSQLIRLVYASHSVHKPNGGAVDPVVGSVLAQSRRNNPKNEIGGILFFGDGYFFQCLEGEAHKVIATYNRIVRDDRHTGAQVLLQRSIDERLFTDWSMKYIPAADGVKALLKKHGYRRFTPFEFSHDLIELLITRLHREQQGLSSANGRAATHGSGLLSVASDNVESPSPQPGLWQKLAARIGLS